MYIFVEGYDDEKFFEYFYKDYDDLHIIQYSSMPNKKLNNFIKSINCMPNQNYIFVSDSDGKSISEKKEILSGEFTNLDLKNVIIVCQEIESWYYAGISEDYCIKNKFRNFLYKTDYLTKEIFNTKLPLHKSRIIIMIEILNNYSINLALERNLSFKYFYPIKDEFIYAV